jgi:hypothetical protein
MVKWMQDDKCFFECSPSEARRARKFLLEKRFDDQAESHHRAKWENQRLKAERVVESVPRWLSVPSIEVPGNQFGHLSIRGLNESFSHIEKDSRIVSHVILHAFEYAAIRGWGKCVFDEYPSEQVVATGIFGVIWTAEIVLCSEVAPGHVILAYEEDDGMNAVTFKLTPSEEKETAIAKSPLEISLEDVVGRLERIEKMIAKS